MSEPIVFYNRRTGQEETEQVYGESWLRWTYHHPLGRLSLWALVKRKWFSRWYGWRMNRAVSRQKIAPFLQEYGLSTEEFLEEVDSFRHFNDFFYRRLQPSARPLPADANAWALPADGRHFLFARAGDVAGVFVKGQRFDVSALLEGRVESAVLEDAAVLLSRLCPVDYHRFHVPVAARVVGIYEVEGSLFSVSPIALRQRLDYLWRNKRVIVELETASGGRFWYIPVGATCVGSIHLSVAVGDEVQRGQEMGYFAFGGSSVVVVVPPSTAERVIWDQTLLAWSQQGREVYDWMGSLLGAFRS